MEVAKSMNNLAVIHCLQVRVHYFHVVLYNNSVEHMKAYRNDEWCGIEMLLVLKCMYVYVA